jgi:hypothetical protein
MDAKEETNLFWRSVEDYGYDNDDSSVLAALVWLNVCDERVLSLARESYLKDDIELPDWIRILRNASDPKAVSDARDDLAQEPGWEWMK